MKTHHGLVKGKIHRITCHEDPEGE